MSNIKKGNNMNFNRASKTALAYAGKTVQDLADYWGISRQATVKRINSDDPKHSHIVSICEFCGVNRDDFMKWGD